MENVKSNDSVGFYGENNKRKAKIKMNRRSRRRKLAIKSNGGKLLSWLKHNRNCKKKET